VGGNDGARFHNTAEVYDPDSGATGSTSPTNNTLASGRNSHTATLLPNGQVLVTGGFGSVPLAATEIYNPASNSWSTASSLVLARNGHTATLLDNGWVLIAGGENNGAMLDTVEVYQPAAYLATAEAYNPGTGTWSATGTMAQSRASHAAR